MNEQLQAQIQAMLDHLRAAGLTAEDMTQLAQAVIMVLQDPARYPELIESAQRAGLIRPGDAPEEFNQQFLTVLLLALKQGVEEEQGAQQEPQQEPQQFAKGGLAQMAQKVAAAGRGGDTMLAHVNPREAEALRRMGGSGTINPNTGLREFKGGILGALSDAVSGIGHGVEDLGKGILGEDLARSIGGLGKDLAPVMSMALPMAVNFFMPGLGTSLAAGMGGGALGAVGSGALMGGLGSALGGGNFAQGALLGGLGAGGGKLLGDAAGGFIGNNFSGNTANIVGSGLAGGALSALQGKGFAQGAMQGAMGGMIGNAVGGMGDPAGNALSRGIAGGGAALGNALTAGYTPQQALMMGALGGLAKGMSPAQIAAGNKPAGYSLTGDKIADTAMLSDMGYGGEEAAKLASGNAGGYIEGIGQGATVAPTGFAGTNIGWDGKSAAAAMMLNSVLGSANTPEQVQQQLQSAPGMSPEQREYFNRAPTRWDWSKLQQEAASKGMGLGQYMATNWRDVAQGKYNTAGSGQQTPAFRNGGALNAMRYAQGGGSGRDDTIDARLSDGEYVMDAETVAMLGDGSNKEGAQRLDKFRQEVRKHKGNALARGKISPDAKSPLQYMKEAA